METIDYILWFAVGIVLYYGLSFIIRILVSAKEIYLLDKQLLQMHTVIPRLPTKEAVNRLRETIEDAKEVGGNPRYCNSLLVLLEMREKQIEARDRFNKLAEGK